LQKIKKNQRTENNHQQQQNLFCFRTQVL